MEALGPACVMARMSCAARSPWEFGESERRRRHAAGRPSQLLPASYSHRRMARAAKRRKGEGVGERPCGGWRSGLWRP